MIDMKKTITLILAFVLAAFVSAPVALAAGADDVASFVEKKPKKKAEVKEVTFSVHLHCQNCVKKVQENIAFEKGVKDLHVCLEDQIVAIKYDASKTSEAVLKAAIEKLGYPVSGIVEPGQESGHHHQH